MEKSILREKYIDIRNNVEDKLNKSLVITSNVAENELYKKANVIALYRALKNEVYTDVLIYRALYSGKEVVLPRVIGDYMAFFRIYSLNDKFDKSEFGILEPEYNLGNYYGIDDIDLFIVPGICFDRNNYRVGYGKGYYDRYFSYNEKDTIGICFSDQLLLDDYIDYDKNDIKMKYVITEKK